MKFYNIFFSPIGGTKKVANIVAKGTKLDAEEIGLCVYRRHGGCCRTFSDAPIWNRTPGSAGRKGIAGICSKDHAKR